MKTMVLSSELLGNHSNCAKHKITALAYITDELLHKCEHVDFLTSLTGQVCVILIAHFYILFVLNYKMNSLSLLQYIGLLFSFFFCFVSFSHSSRLKWCNRSLYELNAYIVTLPPFFPYILMGWFNKLDEATWDKGLVGLQHDFKRQFLQWTLYARVLSLKAMQVSLIFCNLRTQQQKRNYMQVSD